MLASARWLIQMCCAGYPQWSLCCSSDCSPGLPLPQFLIHDGVFHGVSRRTVVRAMNHVYGVLDRIGTGQYFVTFNEDELASSPEDELRDGKFAFSLDAATVARFDDSPEGRLFGRSFS